MLVHLGDRGAAIHEALEPRHVALMHGGVHLQARAGALVAGSEGGRVEAHEGARSSAELLLT